MDPAKVDKKIKPPAIGSHDLVLAVLDDPDSDEIEQRHILCVVGFVGENEVTLKNALMTPDDPRIDQRNFNMLLFTGKKDTKWTLLKICSLENFNRGYAGFDAFQLCMLYKELLDLGQCINDDEILKFPQACLPKNPKAVTGFQSLTRSQSVILEQCLRSYGITAIDGTYNSGKTSLIPLICLALLEADPVMRAEKARQKEATKNFSVKELLEDSDSDEDMYDTSKDTRTTLRNQFMWYQPGYRSVFDENQGLFNNKNQQYWKSQ